MDCLFAYGIHFDKKNNYIFTKNETANVQMNNSINKTFSFLEHSGNVVEPPKLNELRLVPLCILNFVLTLVLTQNAQKHPSQFIQIRSVKKWKYFPMILFYRQIIKKLI